MKILITGGCGFIGSNLALFLKQKKMKVSTLDNLSRSGSVYNSKILKEYNIKNYKIDIRNKFKLLSLPKFDLVIDCCAEAAVEESKKKLTRYLI